MTGRVKIAIIILAVLILASGGYFVYKGYFFKKYQNQNTNLETTSTNLQTASSTPSEILKKSSSGINTIFPGFKLYKNADFGFEIQYPEDWTVSEENMVNVRGENTKGFFFKKFGSDLRFAILPRDGLSYGLSESGTSTAAIIGGSAGVQIKYILKDGRRLWLLFPQTGILNWLKDIGRIDAMTSAKDPVGDTTVFEKMLNSFKLVH